MEDVFVLHQRDVGLFGVEMTTSEFIRWLKKQGILVKNKKKTGHRILYNPANNSKSQIPVHGRNKEMGTGLITKIKKDLGL